MARIADPANNVQRYEADVAAPAIVGGAQHNLALKSDGGVYAWGLNNVGQLGNGSQSDHSYPAPVAAGEQQVYRCTSCGAVHDSAIAAANCPDCTGATTLVESSYLENIVAIAAGTNFSAALDADGNVWVWGYAIGIVQSNVPVRANFVNSYLEDHATPTHPFIVDIAAGQDHILALDSEGTVWSWGMDDYGQLGQDEPTAYSEAQSSYYVGEIGRAHV